MSEEELLSYLQEIAVEYGTGMGCDLYAGYHCVAQSDCGNKGCAIIREAIRLLQEKKE